MAAPGHERSPDRRLSPGRGEGAGSRGCKAGSGKGSRRSGVGGAGGGRCAVPLEACGGCSGRCTPLSPCLQAGAFFSISSRV